MMRTGTPFFKRDKARMLPTGPDPTWKIDVTGVNQTRIIENGIR